MKKNTKVKWIVKSTGQSGHGVVISDEEGGHVLVRVESEGEVHHVIHCAVTWLTPVD